MKIVISPWNINSKSMNGWNNRWDPESTLNLRCVSINMAWNSHNLHVMDCSKHPKHRTPESFHERLSVDPSRSTSRLSKIQCLSTFILEKNKKKKFYRTSKHENVTHDVRYFPSANRPAGSCSSLLSSYERVKDLKEKLIDVHLKASQLTAMLAI